MQLILLCALTCAGALSEVPPTEDPLALEVGLQKFRRSEIVAAVGPATSATEQHRSLLELVMQSLLLQEAERSKLVSNLASAPKARAKQYLEAVVSERVICSRLTERELGLMYEAMRPRFVHGHLYRIAELTLGCWEPAFGCGVGLKDWGQMHWGPLADAIHSADELHMLWDMTKLPPGVIQFRQYTIHVDEAGSSSAPVELVQTIQRLKEAQAQLIPTPRTIRLPLLVDYEPPAHRTMEDSSVREQVIRELCPRVVRRNREAYMDGLRRSAYIKVHRSGWPAAIALPQAD